MTTVALLRERQKTHGEFADHARCATKLKDIVADEIARRRERGQAPIAPTQRQSLDMICDKLARIVAGDPDHRDHWDDVAGYALLCIGFDPAADSVGSYEAAIREIGRRIREGEEAAPTSGYFAADDRLGTPAPDAPLPPCQFCRRCGAPIDAGHHPGCPEHEAPPDRRDDADAMALQNREFDALTELARHWDTLQKVPVVDDDYPEHRHSYERALRDFIAALRANGRLEP